MVKYNEFTDRELTALLKEGDINSFTEIYERYFRLLYVHAFKRLKDEDEATDIIQDLFEFLWAKRAQLEITTQLSSYLYAAVRNRIFTFQLRSERATVYTESLREFANEGVYVTDLQVRERELSFIIEREINALPPQMKRVFEMSRKDGLGYKQISEITGTSVQTVRDQVKKSIKILKGRILTIIFISI